MPKRIIPLVLLALLALAALGYWLLGRDDDDSRIVLQGNVDLRQVELPFNDSERIAEVLVEEGTACKAGQVLARLDTRRLLPRVAQAEARVAAQRRRCRNFAMARARRKSRRLARALAAAQAEAANATSNCSACTASAMNRRRAVSPQDLEAAHAAARMSEAQAESARKALELALAGPRKEDIAQAQAQLDAAEAELALLKRQLDGCGTALRRSTLWFALA